MQLKSQNAIAVKNKDQKVIWDVSEALAFKLLTLMEQWEVYRVWTGCLVEVLKYVANIPLSELIHRGPIFGVGVSGLYSEFHGIISNDWGSHFFGVIVAGELLIWEVNIYHYIRIYFRIVKHDWNELKLQKKKKKNAALPKTCSSRVGMFRSSDEQLFLKYLCLIFTMDVGNSRLLIQIYFIPGVWQALVYSSGCLEYNATNTMNFNYW